MNHEPRGWSRLEWRAVPAGLLLLSCLACGGRPLVAEDRPAILSVAVGLGGWVKVGKWAPVRVDVGGGRSSGLLRLVLTTSDPVERTAAFVSSPVVFTAGTRTRLVGWFQPGRLGGDLGVSIEIDGVAVDRRTVSMATAPRRPFGWRMRIGDMQVSSGVDRIVIPVRKGQTVVFVNGDPHAAHGLVIPGGPVEGLRETTGSVGELVDPASLTAARSERPVVARYEVTAELSQPVPFHGLSTGWALSGSFVPGDSRRSEAAAPAAVIEVVFEGSPVVLSQSETLWVAWGGAAGMDVTGLERGADRPVESVHRAVPWSGSSRRIDRVVDLDAIDAVVLAAGGGYAVDENDSRALSEWVAAGGHLVVSVGSQRAAWLQSPLASWVPIRAEGDRQLSDSDLRGLETLAVAGERIPFLGRVGGTVLGLPDGRASVGSLSGPLIGEAAYGFGRVTMLSVDIDRRPLTRWVDLPKLVARLVAGSRSDELVAVGDRSRTTPGGDALTYSGISDLKTQLHGVQDDFQQVSRLGIWQVLLLVIAVLLLVGPVDFLVVRHLLKRPRATWVTLPLIIVTTTGLAVWSGGAANGREVLVNQLDILDLDTLSGQVDGRTWATVYSGQSRRLRIEARPASWLSTGSTSGAGSDCRMGWSGVPEATFGGMHRDGRRLLDEPDYRVTAGAGKAPIADLPVAVRSTRALSAAWRRSRAEALVAATLESSGGGQLVGELSHELPGSIEDWLIAYGNRVYLPRSADGRRGSWAPGTSLQLEREDVRNESLKRYLTRTTTRTVARKEGFGADVVVAAGQYQPLNRDPADWLEILTFHRAAGGSGYTGLENRDLAALDLSQLILLDRAVLIGRLVLSSGDAREAAGAGTELLIDGERVSSAGSRRVTYVRIVLPVARRRARPAQMFVDPDQAAPK